MGGSNDILLAIALLVPMGTSPFLALAMLGAAQHLGGWAPPEGLAPLLHPALTVLYGVLAGVFGFGRSSKLSKPFAELAGTLESLLALGAVSLTLAPVLGASPLYLAGGLALALIAAGAVIVLRTAIDLASWLAPVPFLDLGVQALKTVLTAALVGLALFAPSVALAADLAIIVAAVLSLAWCLRLGRYGWNVVRDQTLGRLEPKVSMPVDAVVAEDLGPFPVFAVEVPGIKRRAKGRLELRAGRWFVMFPRWLGEERSIPLGDAYQAEMKTDLFGTTLSLPGGKVRLPPRYRHLIPELERRAGAAPAVIAERSTEKSAARRPIAQPSTS